MTRIFRRSFRVPFQIDRLGALAAVLLAGITAPAVAQTQAVAASGPPLNLTLFVSSRNDVCFDPGDVAAIKRLATLEQERINREGGIGGRRLQLSFLDYGRDDQRAVATMRTALASPQTLAMIGLSNSARAKAVFDAAGREIGESGIPFLSDIAINSIYDRHANVFTTRASQDDERMPVLVEFIKQLNVSRTAFVGIRDALFSMSLGDGLKSALGEKGLAADHRLRLSGENLNPGEVAAVIDDLKRARPDMLFLSIGGNRTGAFLKAMTAAGVMPALFVSGRIDAIPAEILGAYQANIYQLAWDRLPEVYSERLRKLISRAPSADWVFEGRKIAEAPGWASGQCKAKVEDAAPDPLSAANLRAIGIGAQFADMVGLVTAAARTADPRADLAALRRQVMGQLKSTYASGRGAFQGSFDNWSFNPTARAAARTPFIVMQAKGLGRTQLAPIQFVRTRNDTLRRIDTLYLDVDLIRAHRIDDNEKTFFAEFHLAMRGASGASGASIEQIDFGNAFLDPRTNDRQITVRTMHQGGKSDAYPEGMKIYHVTGKFVFEPRLENYPFDSQRFSIDLQPKQGDSPFIVQPPPHALRDQAVVTDGWSPKEQYVGYDEDFVATVDARTHEQSIAPFYKASFVWLMKRQTTDYYLRVVVPLAFILTVAYLAIFIPLAHFEAIVTIQVTALLSAVALYLALPKIDTDTATLSDRIFLFDYMAVSLMIGISIMRVNHFVAERPRLRTLLSIAHIVLIPILVGLMAWYVSAASLAEV